MLAPIPFKFGQSFKNKSEELRYLRNCSELFKLRTLLINDPSNARETLMSVSHLLLSSCFAFSRKMRSKGLQTFMCSGL